MNRVVLINLISGIMNLNLCVIWMIIELPLGLIINGVCCLVSFTLAVLACEK